MKRLAISLLFFVMLFVSCSAPKTEIPEEGMTDSETISGSQVIRLIEPSQLSLFRAEIGDATALGIRQGSVKTSSSSVTSRTLEDTQNYLVKSTTEYIPGNPQFDDTGLTSVIFTATTTSETIREISGEKRIVAAGSKDFPHMGTIAFASSDGFSYSVTGQNDDVIIEDIKDNDSNDLDPDNGVIRIGNLTKGNKYIVAYYGTSTEVSVTQNEINGEIDKLYVLNGFTFISYVPQGMSERPTPNELEYDTDGIAMYDKTDYFTNNTRQSFIIDNTSGYIYPIENFHIRKIEGGCILSSNDNAIYDFRITENDGLEIYSILSNSSVTWYDVFKDKYGHIYVYNDRLEGYYPDTNTFYFKYRYPSSTEPFYMLNSNGEAVKFQRPEYSFTAFTDVSIITEDGSERELNADDNFDIYYWESMDVIHVKPYKAIGGKVYGYAQNEYDNNLFTITSPILFLYDPFEETTYITSFAINSSDWYYGVYALEDYDIFLIHSVKDEAVYYINNAWDYFTTVFENAVSFEGQSASSEASISSLPDDAKKFLSDCSISDDHSSFLTYGPHGNTYYDVVVEYGENGEPIVNSYISGTYEEPQKQITLQPINRV